MSLFIAGAWTRWPFQLKQFCDSDSILAAQSNGIKTESCKDAAAEPNTARAIQYNRNAHTLLISCTENFNISTTALEELKKIKEENNLTVLSITHDIDEAANANRIFVMKKGELIQEGTPEEIFSQGEKLIELGLDLPFPERLKSALKARGVDVPKEYMTEEGMVDWLWTSVLNK